MTPSILRRVLGLLTTLALAPSALAAQAGTPLSAAYAFVASVDDTRALWVNPGGLAAVPEYSLAGGFVLDRFATGSFRLAQWSLGFNSRGLAFGYQRDRLPDDPFTPSADPRSTSAYRFGFAVRSMSNLLDKRLKILNFGFEVLKWLLIKVQTEKAGNSRSSIWERMRSMGSSSWLPK